MSTGSLDALNAVYNELYNFKNPSAPAEQYLKDIKAWYKDVTKRTKDIYPFLSIGETSSSTTTLTCGPLGSDIREFVFKITIGVKNLSETDARTACYAFSDIVYTILRPSRCGTTFIMPLQIDNSDIHPVSSDPAGFIWEATFDITAKVLADRPR